MNPPQQVNNLSSAHLKQTWITVLHQTTQQTSSSH